VSQNSEVRSQKLEFRGRMARTFGVLAFVCAIASGCQQKMAEQPAPRAYDAYTQGVFNFDQSARTPPSGTIHRGQRSPDDAMLTYLTPAGKYPKVSEEWKKSIDPTGNLQPSAGAPTSVENFVNEFPFEMTEADLTRGQQRYNVFCAVCHGASGHGNGKIVERGFLRPPSYHQDPAGVAKDWSTGNTANAQKPKDGEDDRMSQGHSRGFFRYGVKVPIEQVPVGYIYQVITWGYGGMPDHASQIPPEDRWRITAYVRVLQASQATKVTDEIKKKIDEAGKAKADEKHEKH
jgi:mono/diheme cytochrome c family protein